MCCYIRRVTHTDTIDLFLEAARAHAGKAAISGTGGTVTYAALERLARQYAAAFAGATEPRVFIALPRGKHAYAAMLGAALSGGRQAAACRA
jgi:acyl-CoA synthetase (AMP-forming)/AMP-acid ligase II